MEVILLITVAVAVLALSLVTIVGRWKDLAAWSFSVTMVATAAWAIGIAVFFVSNDAKVVTNAVIIYYIAAALIALAVFYTTLAMVGRLQERQYISQYFFPLLPFLALSSLFVFAPFLFIEQVSIGPSGNTVALNLAGYVIYMIYFFLYYGAALGFLLVKLLQSQGITRKRFAYLLAGYTTGGAIGMTFNLVLPITGNYSLIWVGPLGLLVFVPIVYMTITRYGLFDIRRTFARTAAYVSAFTIVAVFYIAIGALIFSYIPNTPIMQIALALILALVFNPIKLFFDRITDKVFYRSDYSPEKLYESLSDSLAHTIELHALQRKAAKTIQDALKTEQVFFSVFNEDGVKIETAGTAGHARLSYDEAWMIAAEKENLLYTEWLARDNPVRRLMVSHRIEIIQFLRTGDKLLGFLCLGEQRSRGYIQRDINIVGTIADELAIAIQNARSLQALRDLNGTLQQRIDSATKELRASNAQLQRLDEAKDEFISMASHQLRTPLTSIKGYISMIVEGDAGTINPMQKKLLEEAFLSSERMVRLINDFLNVSRLQTGKFLIEKHDTDLARVVQQEIDSLGPSAASRGMKFSYVMPKRFPVLQLDEGKIRQVIMNFSDNAMYYSKDASTIKVSLKKDKDGVIFTVKDTGIGVPLPEQAHLFNKFFRATNARKQRPDGTGVGLFLAKKVIDAHDGEVVFESKEGKGSTFGFRLPIVESKRR